MASASPMAILALPDRAMPERPDGKPGEATDGRFAGLMAQFSQPQAAPSPVDPARGPTARVHRSMARKAAPATDALPASAEVGHRAAAAATPEAGLPGPTRTDPSVPKPPAPEAKAAGPLATAPMVSAQDTSAAALKPATTPPAIEPRALAGEASPQGPATLPAVLLPPEAIPTPKAAPVEVPAVLAPTSGLAAAAAAGTTPTRGLPEPPSPPRAPQRPMAPPMSEHSTGPTNTLPPAPNMAPPTARTPVAPDAAPPLLEEQAPKTPAQPTDPALPQADLAGPGPVLQGTRRSGESAPGPVAKADPSPAGTKPAQDLQALAGPTPNGVAPTLRGILQRVTEAPTPSAAPTNAPPPALHPAAPSAQVLAAPDAIPTQQTATPSADTALLQGVPAQLGSSLTVSFGSEDPAPSPALQTTPSPDAGTGSKPLPPAALPQALAQLLAKAMSQPVVAEAEGMIRQATPATAPQPAPEVTVPNAPALIAPEAAPTQTSAAQPASPAPLQAVPAAPGASSLKDSRSSEDLVSSPTLQISSSSAAATNSKPLAPTARPQKSTQLLAKAMSQPAAVEAEGTTRQGEPATAPQPGLDADAPDVQALTTPNATPAPKSPTQSQGSDFLQAAFGEPGTSLGVTLGRRESLPGFIAKAVPSSAAEPTTGKPSAPAVLPQTLAQLPPKAALQPTADAQVGIQQALLKDSGTLVGPEPVEPKPTLDLLPPTNRTPDGTAFTLLGTASHAPEAPAAATPAAPAMPPAATSPPSAPVLQVAGGLRWMIIGGSQEAQLQLHPDSLGLVTIHLKVEGGQVHAKVWISEAASMQAIKEGQPHLEQALKEQGLHLGSFDLQQGHRHFQEAPSAPMLREQGLNEAPVARQEAPAPPPVAILNPHHVELYA